jgi:hypothetical protein
MTVETLLLAPESAATQQFEILAPESAATQQFEIRHLQELAVRYTADQ